jgi:hypothetical protein
LLLLLLLLPRCLHVCCGALLQLHELKLLLLLQLPHAGAS